jgi:Zn-dependent protease
MSSHSLVARKYGVPMKGITLFIFGGVAEMDDGTFRHEPNP